MVKSAPDSAPLSAAPCVFPHESDNDSSSVTPTSGTRRLTHVQPRSPHRWWRWVTRAVPCFFLLLLAILPALAAEKLNVLLIISDDLRDTVGCYGNAGVKTPNIDRLAARGVRFDHADVQYPVCNPSRTSFLTGMRCEQTRVVDNKTMFRDRLPDVVTLPQLLRQSGWHSASFGKVFHVGEVMGEIRKGWMDVGKSWDEGQMFQPTAASHVIEGRNLTDGKLAWCNWGAMSGGDDDQPDGQTARHAIQTMEKYTAASGRGWLRPVFIGPTICSYPQNHISTSIRPAR